MKCFIVLILITLNSVFAQRYVMDRDTLSRYKSELLQLNEEFSNYYQVLSYEDESSALILSRMESVDLNYSETYSYFDELFLLSIINSFNLQEKDKRRFQDAKLETIKHLEKTIYFCREHFSNYRLELKNNRVIENLDKVIKLLDNFLKKFNQVE